MKVGIVALGSHKERHGAALPLDTDALIAEHIACEVVKRSPASFLGVLRSSYELPGIDTGKHQMLDELEEEVKEVLHKAKVNGIGGVVLVNAHGGNQGLVKRLGKIEADLGLRIIFNNSICEMEGPHAGTGETSIGAVIGIADEFRLDEHIDFDKHPEVGFVGLEHVRNRYEWAEEHAREVLEEGIEINECLGQELLHGAIDDVLGNVKELLG